MSFPFSILGDGTVFLMSLTLRGGSSHPSRATEVFIAAMKEDFQELVEWLGEQGLPLDSIKMHHRWEEGHTSRFTMSLHLAPADLFHFKLVFQKPKALDLKL